MRPYLLCLLCFCTFYMAKGQSPYQLNTGAEIGIIATGAGLNGLSGYLAAKRDIISPEEIEGLNAMDIWKFDRWVTKLHNERALKSSDIFLRASFALPLTLLLDENGRKDFGTVALLSAETLLINGGLTNIFKTSVGRARPMLYNPDIPIELKLKKTSSYSFFSGHTSYTAALSFLTAKLYTDYNPNVKGKGFIYGLAALVPAYTGMQRIRGGKHFLSDVMVGYLVGALTGLLVPELHRL